MMWMIYLVGTVNEIADAVIGIGFLFLLLGLIKFLIILATTDWETDTYSFKDLSKDEQARRLTQKGISLKKLIKNAIIFPVIATLFFISGNLIPSSSTLAAMYLLPKLAQNQQLQQIPDKALTLLNDKLEEWIKQTQK